MLTFIGTGGIIGIVVAVVIVLLIVGIISWIIGAYNKLVKARNKVKNQFSQIDVQLKRRFDLIPNLVETVKGYAAHEKSILEDFAAARGAYQKAAKEGDIAGMASANTGLSGVLTRFMAVSEKYPELKADVQFKELSQTLRDTEGKIAIARQMYNDVVLSYNNTIELFPSNIVAKWFNFNAEQYFKTEEAERENVKVKF